VAKPRTGNCRAVEDGATNRAAARGKSARMNCNRLG